MQEGHIFKCEQERRYHRRFPRKFKFTANKIECDNTYRAEDYREETPPESSISEYVNLLHWGMAGYSRAAGAALHGDFI